LIAANQKDNNYQFQKEYYGQNSKSPFVKDKQENMLVMTNPTSLIEISHHSKSQATFDG
jgi:hypothetical protein